MEDLSENWTTVAKGALGYIGFMGNAEQSSDLRILKIWFVTDGKQTSAPDWEKILTKLFHSWSWKDAKQDQAIITVQLSSPLKDPYGLLTKLATQIEQWHFDWTCGSYAFTSAMECEPACSPEESVPRQIWFTECPGGHNGWE